MIPIRPRQYLVVTLIALLSSVFSSASDQAQYLGAEACGECHREQYRLWQGSHHDWAMRPATSDNVLGDFDQVHFDHYGVKSRFYRRGDSFYVETDNADGKLQEFEIAYTFGFYPLQQYLIAFPKGRYQALSLAWDSRPAGEGGQRWFHLYPDEAIPHDDVLHWTGTHFNWNSRCADCHSTNLQRNYDPERNGYDTRWSEINVACEACHGPGGDHLAWARRGKSSVANKGLTRDLNAVGHWLWKEGSATAQHSTGRPQDMEGELGTCGSCHSRRALVDDPDLPGNFHDKHQLQLLEAPGYHPDGQVRDEVYVLGSFLQSKMYHRGVTCSNCHDPHSLKLRAPGNSVCTQCHSAQQFDTEKHHHHPPGGGSRCVNCHMPETTYMVVDPRRDHSLRIPRPDLSDKLGTPNACTQCHTDRSDTWAAKALSGWFEQSGKTLPPHYGEDIAAAQQGAPDVVPRLVQLATQGDAPAIVKGTALSMLQEFPDRGALASARNNLKDEDPLVRIGAIKALEFLPPQQRIADLFPLLQDRVKSVRLEAARSLSAVPEQGLDATQKSVLSQSRNEYLDVLKMRADTPNGQINLGIFHLGRGDRQGAERAYRQALALDPKHLGAHMNLADFYREMGRDEEGERLLRAAIEIAPKEAAPRHALGLLLVRQKRHEEAEKFLAEAAELEPENIRYGYVYAIALDSRGKPGLALDLLEQLHTLHPANPQLLQALLDAHYRRREWFEALCYAEKLSAVQPHSPRVKLLVKDLKSRISKGN